MKKVVFDVDDTMWSLTNKVLTLTGIDRHKITEYLIEEIDVLTPEEKDLIVNLYAQSSTFEDIEWYNGVDRIRSLSADSYICSNNVTLAVLEQKSKELMKANVVPEDHIILHICGKNYTDKQLPDEMFILVEDSPYNIAKSTAKHTIVIKTLSNMSTKSKAIIQRNNKTNLHYCNTLNEAIDLIEQLLQETEN